MLWTMSQQVRTERLTTSRQLVLQGFVPSLEDRNAEAAMIQRDQWILSILREHTRLPERRLAFKASHATAIESLSRLSIITMEEASVAALAARSLAGKRLTYAGGASVTVKRQQAAYDRLVSAPAKRCMDILTRADSSYQGKLKPNWKEGTVHAMNAAAPVLLLRWVVNPERAKVKIYVIKKHLLTIEQHIDAEIRRLQFGSALGDSKGKGADYKGGSKGKGKKGSKGIPADDAAFKQEPIQVRPGLVNMTFSRYPFNISIRTLEGQEEQHDLEPMPVDQEGPHAAKRFAEA